MHQSAQEVGSVGQGPEHQGSLVCDETTEKPAGQTTSEARTLQALAWAVGIFPRVIGSYCRIWVNRKEVI